MEVVIDGVVYVPKCEIPPRTDESLKECLASLTEIQYFGGCSHKHKAWAWDAMRAIAPDIAEISSNDCKVAYDMFHEE